MEACARCSHDHTHKLGHCARTRGVLQLWRSDQMYFLDGWRLGKGKGRAPYCPDWGVILHPLTYMREARELFENCRGGFKVVYHSDTPEMDTDPKRDLLNSAQQNTQLIQITQFFQNNTTGGNNGNDKCHPLIIHAENIFDVSRTDSADDTIRLTAAATPNHHHHLASSKSSSPSTPSMATLSQANLDAIIDCLTNRILNRPEVASTAYYLFWELLHRSKAQTC